ncbi:MAG: NifB/NifX family molybdenum-iron cluster-binding protein [Spirochaetales bacterium]|nr:NifB/NifX family molybdenum-iron cluster-binding protein [Spirochaetales bacterium]
MKIAVPADNGYVSEHFGRCPEFTIAEITDSTIIKTETVANPGHEPGRIPLFLKEMGVSVIITGGMGRRAIQLFDDMGIDYVLGVTGKVEDAIKAFCTGTLAGGESLCRPQHLGERHGGDCDHHGGHA